MIELLYPCFKEYSVCFWKGNIMSEMQRTMIESIADVIEIAYEWRKKYKGHGFPKTWYRGQAEDLPLYSGVYRGKYLQRAEEEHPDIVNNDGSPDMMRRLISLEYSMTAGFMRRAAPFFTSDMTPVEKYFIAQHHGFPTRLLDWTGNPLVALYFACSGEINKDGCLYVVEPSHIIRPINEDWCHSYLEQPQHSEDFRKEFKRLLEVYPHDVVSTDHPYVQFTVQHITKPSPTVTSDEVPLYNAYMHFASVLPVSPSMRFGRVMQQSARFTLDMPFVEQYYDKNGKRYFDNVVTKYYIASTDKRRIIEELETVEISEGTVYYDLDSLSRSFKKIYNI